MTINEVLVNGKLHRVEVLERKKNTFLVEVNEKTVEVEMSDVAQDETIVIGINSTPLETQVRRIQGSTFQVKIDRKLFEVQVQFQPKISTEPARMLKPMATTTRRPVIGSPTKKDAVVAPLAGRIAVLKIKVGQRVERGELVCVLEAMKMENEIAAPKAGLVKEIRVSKGSVVDKGDVLAVIS